MQFLEELDRNAIVATFTEVSRIDEVTATQVNADVHVGRDLAYASVVKLDVLLQKFVGRVCIVRIFLPALKHGLGAEI